MRGFGAGAGVGTPSNGAGAGEIIASARVGVSSACTAERGRALQHIIAARTIHGAARLVSWETRLGAIMCAHIQQPGSALLQV